MPPSDNKSTSRLAREKFLGLSLESTRKSYYPQLKRQLDVARKNERQLQLLIDKVPARIAYVDLAERFVFVNREYEKSFGSKRDQIVGRSIVEIVGEENYSRLKGYIGDVLKGNLVHFETVLEELHAQSRHVDLTYIPDLSQQGTVKGFYVFGIDITDQKRAAKERSLLEARLQQAQKHEAISTLAGGIAHDFNNLMMGVQGQASLMATDLDAAHPHMENIRAIEQYIKSAMTLTRQLLGFARGGKYEVKPINISSLVRDSATMFGRTHKEIKVHTQQVRSMLVVDVDYRQIEQVLLNIYVNALQAMPDGGDLHLATDAVTLGERFSEAHGIAPGRYARVRVTDSGIGMDEDTCQRVFDPFFTTKEKARGTGLGLASAYGIIKNHDGAIMVQSAVGRGTTFTIYLRLSSHEVQPEAPINDSLLKGLETILLIDDEEMIIAVAKAMLEKLGYRVIVAKGGKQAVEVMEAKGDQIDLALLDLIMPGADGGWTFDRLRAIKPTLPVILSSGYAIDGKAEQIMRRGCNGFIQKPFRISEISQKIRNVLDALNGPP
jgi:PAS domain S-box-containing protein